MDSNCLQRRSVSLTDRTDAVITVGRLAYYKCVRVNQNRNAVSGLGRSYETVEGFLSLEYLIFILLYCVTFLQAEEFQIPRSFVIMGSEMFSDCFACPGLDGLEM